MNLGNIIKSGAGAINKFSSLYGIANIVAALTGNATLGALFNARGYTPSQWGHYPRGNKEALIRSATNIGGQFFDAVITASHESTLTVTQHPVQNGSNISDHAIVNPARLTLSVGMSDAMADMVPGGYIGEGETKSIKAFNSLLLLQAMRVPLVVYTKLKTYDNMVITSVTADDDYTTAYGLKANVELQQIIIVDVAETTVSSRQWTTGKGTERTSAPQEIERESTAASILKDGKTNQRAALGRQK